MAYPSMPRWYLRPSTLARAFPLRPSSTVGHDSDRKGVPGNRSSESPRIVILHLSARAHDVFARIRGRRDSWCALFTGLIGITVRPFGTGAGSDRSRKL